MKSYMFDTTVVLESIIIDRTVLFSKRKKKKKKDKKTKIGPFNIILTTHLGPKSF